MSPTILLRVPLGFRLIAEVLVDDADRAPYVAPAVARGEHDERCRCDQCRAARALGRTGA